MYYDRMTGTLLKLKLQGYNYNKKLYIINCMHQTTKIQQKDRL